jgi:asparagine synthase (glutamine-hydrolysing)
MCGFAGLLGDGTRRGDDLRAAVTRMAATLEHRGPDDAGAWVDPAAGVALGHRRLSVLDLSPAGHQPMQSPGGSVLALNGEIYNHLELRGALEAAGAAPAWRGHSDTETLLAAFERWGVEEALRRCVGMFALAWWNGRERTLHLARDRFGEKPLYYGWVGGAFVFGSELKALRALPGFANGVCRRAVAEFLRLRYVPAPRSIHEGVYKLEPGCTLTLRGAAPPRPPAEPLRAPAGYEGISLRRWWSLAQVVEDGARDPLRDEAQALDALDAALREAVRLQSLADVPLGAFLSGGVDSSTIVALMQQQASRPVKTFTVAFEDAGFDESPHARAVARHLGTDHAELSVTAGEVRAVIPRLPAMYDEPFADSSQIPTHLVCRAARRHVTVALSGDAGDELFGGYNRYLWGPRIWRHVAWMPHSLRRALGGAIAALPVGGWDALGRAANAVLPGTRGVALLGDKAQKLAATLHAARSVDGVYLAVVSDWQDPERVIPGAGRARAPEVDGADALPEAGIEDASLRMMFRDSLGYLPDDILCKVDRAAMAVGLETRVPFLDHRVAELAWRLPLAMKIRGGEGKWALRQILYRHVPRELIERPKAGFAVPIGGWLRGPLRPWAESLLDPRRIASDGHLDPAPIRALWAQHLAGRRDWTSRLWTILMFQAWQGARC